MITEDFARVCKVGAHVDVQVSAGSVQANGSPGTQSFVAGIGSRLARFKLSGQSKPARAASTSDISTPEIQPAQRST